MAKKILDATDASKSKNTLTRVHFILDESGSMCSCQLSTIDGFNEYINGLKKDKNGNKFIISLTKFEGGNLVRVFTDRPVKKVPDLNRDSYTPLGMTNLNDAIGATLLDMEQNPLKRRKKHGTLVIVMTDGYENASREWTHQTVSDLIKKKEKDGWTVTFLGADIDSQAVGSSYAIKTGNIKSFNKAGMKNAMRGLTEATVMYAACADSGVVCDSLLSEEMTGMSDADWMAKDDDDSSEPAIAVKDTQVDPLARQEILDSMVAKIDGEEEDSANA